MKRSKIQYAAGGYGLQTAVVIMLSFAGLAAQASAVGTEAVEPVAVNTLVTVNGSPITDADIDALILGAHRGGGMKNMTKGRIKKVFEKAVNDRLLIQEAEAIGLGEERSVRVPLAEALAGDARALYIRDHFQPDAAVSAAEIQRYFEEYYRTIHVRQLSVRTKRRADRAWPSWPVPTWTPWRGTSPSTPIATVGAPTIPSTGPTWRTRSVRP